MKSECNSCDALGRKLCSRARKLSCLAAMVTTLGCQAMPGPAYPDSLSPGTYRWGSEKTAKTAHEYCAAVEGAARSQATGYNALGWLLSGLATATAATPTIISATGGDKLSDTEKGFNIALPVVAALLAAGALGSFTRESHDDLVAKEASLAMLQGDGKAMDVCVSAVADWHGQRGETSEAVRTRMVNAAKDESAAAEAAPTLNAIPASRREAVAARLTALATTAQTLQGKPQARETVDKLSALLQLPTPNLQQVAQFTRLVQDSDPALAADGKALEELLVDILGLQPLPKPDAPVPAG